MLIIQFCICTIIKQEAYVERYLEKPAVGYVLTCTPVQSFIQSLCNAQNHEDSGQEVKLYLSNCVHCEIDCGLDVGDRWVGLSTSETSDLLRFSLNSHRKQQKNTQ